MLHDKSSMIAFDGEGVEGGITGSVNVEATVTVSSPPKDSLFLHKDLDFKQRHTV